MDIPSPMDRAGPATRPVTRSPLAAAIP